MTTKKKRLKKRLREMEAVVASLRAKLREVSNG